MWRVTAYTAAGVLVLAATNRRQAVDPALLRPGRFDTHIEVPLPSKEERQEILKIHSRNLSLVDNLDFRVSQTSFKRAESIPRITFHAAPEMLGRV